MTENKDLQEQIEFYFSDSNYPRDKFLRSQAAQNEEGYIPIEVIANFNRIKAITSDMPRIVEVMKKSPELKVSADGKMVKRAKPLPEEDTSVPRSIYAKGFPETGFEIEDVRSVFNKFGKILSVRNRFQKFNKKPKPSTFVEFSTVQEAEAASKAEGLKFKDKPITVMMKADYLAKKKQERKDKQEKIKQQKRKTTDDQNEEDNKNSNNNSERKKQKSESTESGRISGAILKLTGIGETVSRETLKETFAAYGTVAFVDFNQGSNQAHIRFETSDVAQSTLKALKKEPKDLGGKTPECEVLAEADEKAYWDNVHVQKSKSKSKKKFGGKRRKY